ncbi:MAG: hypothetical protein ACLSAH_02010 [Bilophila wadsworthia]
MPPVETLGLFCCIGVMGSPRPTSFVLTQSALYGARAGFATTCGLITGLFVHITAVSPGRRSVPEFGNGVQCAEIRGGRHLLYLAWLPFRSGTSKASPRRRNPGYGTLYRRG